MSTRRFVALASLVQTVAAAGCEDRAADETSGFPPLGEPVLLAEAAAWVLAPAVADPRPEHRGDDASCDVGFQLEYGTFEVDTGLCTYGLFEQPSMHDLPADTPVRVTIVHDLLYAPEPAMAHVLMVIGDEPVFEAEVEVPGPYGLLEEVWIPDRDIAAGTPVRLHLHNHGVNSWRILDVWTL